MAHQWAAQAVVRPRDRPIRTPHNRSTALHRNTGPHLSTEIPTDMDTLHRHRADTHPRVDTPLNPRRRVDIPHRHRRRMATHPLREDMEHRLPLREAMGSNSRTIRMPPRHHHPSENAPFRHGITNARVNP